MLYRAIASPIDCLSEGYRQCGCHFPNGYAAASKDGFLRCTHLPLYSQTFAVRRQIEPRSVVEKNGSDHMLRRSSLSCVELRRDALTCRCPGGVTRPSTRLYDFKITDSQAR
jgi:hypothetical protein